MSDNKNKAAIKELGRLIDILRQLRGPDGCDWDREQTPRSLLPYLLEECYEVIEAVEEKNSGMLKEELGDLLLHIVFQAELALDDNDFHISDCIRGICDKLVRRHPQIFNRQNNKGNDTDWERGSWEKTKQINKKRDSILDGIPRDLPALAKASRLQEKASGIGFDWNDKGPVIDKVYEEFNELKEALDRGSSDDIELEMGDLFFSMVNLSRHIGYNPEIALRKSSAKFYRRFVELEEYVKSKDLSMDCMTIDELDKVWDIIKEKE